MQRDCAQNRGRPRLQQLTHFVDEGVGEEFHLPDLVQNTDYPLVGVDTEDGVEDGKGQRFKVLQGDGVPANTRLSITWLTFRMYMVSGRLQDEKSVSSDAKNVHT